VEFGATSEETWERTIGVNLTGVFLTLQAAAAIMKPRRRGATVITASTNSYDGEALLTAYNASSGGFTPEVTVAARHANAPEVWV
jgi:NAD(P)-dependent dehydrogenase (short-subunit alcohol dehydrogenase family)